MAKSTLEVSDTMSALLETNDLSPHLTGSWDGIRVGFVDFRVWKPLPVWVEAHDEYFQQQASFSAVQNSLMSSNSLSVGRTFRECHTQDYRRRSDGCSGRRLDHTS